MILKYNLFKLYIKNIFINIYLNYFINLYIYLQNHNYLAIYIYKISRIKIYFQNLKTQF